MVGEAAAGQDEEELDEGDDEGDEGADEEQREDVAEEDAADGRHATLSVDHVRHRGDRRRSLERRLRRQKDLKSVLGTRRQCRSQQLKPGIYLSEICQKPVSYQNLPENFHKCLSDNKKG